MFIPEFALHFVVLGGYGFCIWSNFELVMEIQGLGKLV